MIGTEAGEPGAVWRLDRGLLHWRHWDDAVVVYHEMSGATHEFVTFEAWLFDRLLAGPASVDTLASQAKDVVEHEPGVELEAVIAETLALFHQFGLVSPGSAPKE